MKLLRNTGWILALSALAISSVVGCSSNGGRSVGKITATPSASTSSSGAEQVATGLPDGVPLPTGATLAAPTAETPTSDVRGWTAVALTPTGASASATAAGLRDQLASAGWSSRVVGSAGKGLTISSTFPAQNPVRWLNISVTPPLPASGPAITYRFAQLTGPVKSRDSSGDSTSRTGGVQ